MSPAGAKSKLGTFAVGDERWGRARGQIRFTHEDDARTLSLMIDTPVPKTGEPNDYPSLEIARGPIGAFDWTTMLGGTIRLPDPEPRAIRGDRIPLGGGHHQNVMFGPHFENLVGVTIVLGPMKRRLLDVTVTGTALRAVHGSDERVEVPVLVHARCELPPERVAPPPTADPPLGRKVCRACKAVSFEEVYACPSCGAQGWWNE
jgi:hypothetical protein